MDNKLNMQDIIDLLVAKNDISKEEAEEFVVQLFNLIENGLATDRLTKIKDFGSFKLIHVHERESVDVNTKEKIVIPAHNRVSFTPSQSLKTIVNKPFALFETTPLNDGVFADGIPQDIKEDTIEQDEEPALEADIVIANDVPSNEEQFANDEPNEIKDSNINSVELGKSTVSASEHDDETIPVKDASQDVVHSEVATNTVKTSSKDTSKTRANYWPYVIRGTIISLFIIVLFVFAYNYYFPNSSADVADNTATLAPDNKIDAKVELSPAKAQNSLDTIKAVESLPRKTAKMSPGRTLRLIALNKYGNKEFWVYIYQINKSKIENPNVVPVGLVLDLPHQDEYPMDVNNPDDVALAKQLGDEVMKDFGN